MLIGLDGCRISEGCLTDYQTVGGSKTIDMYSLTIPEARSLRHRCQQGWAPSEGSRAALSSLWWLSALLGLVGPI